MKTFKSKAYGATGTVLVGKKLEPMEVERNEPDNAEVKIKVLYCGVCHSDVHQVENDWKNTLYPCVPGHEIVGEIISAGSNVMKFKTGDIVGVGCMIDSCKSCEPCKEGEEQFCEGPHGQTMTYNGYWKPDPDFNTFGGYSDVIVANEKFVFKIPAGMDLKSAPPILCAGITTYSPLKHAGINKDSKVAVVGIGGLGHMAVMIAKAMGATVTAITSKEEKREAALKVGADDVIVSTKKKEMENNEMKFDFVLITIPEVFDLNPYVCLVKRRGALVTVGLLGPYKKPTDNMEVAKLCRTVGGSVIGGTAETIEVLEFCAKNKIQPVIEMVNIEDINDIFSKIKDDDVHFRYVIDMKSLKEKK